MKRHPLRLYVFVAVVFLATPIDSPAQENKPADFNLFRQSIAPEALRRLERDLGLSEPQRAEMQRLHTAYLGRIEAENQKRNLERRNRMSTLQLKYMPELDEHIDIRDLPPAKQLEITTARKQKKDGMDPLLSNQEYVQELNRFSQELIRGTIAAEQNARDSFIDAVSAITSESQVLYLPRALLRLRINMHAFASDAADSHRDPVLHLDVLGLFEEASEHELAKWAEALRDLPASTRSNAVPEEVKQILEDFEQSYCAHVRQFEEMIAQWSGRYSDAHRTGKAALADSLRRQLKRQYKIVYSLRATAVDQLVALANADGSGDGDKFLLRYRRGTCPILYAADQVDHMASWINKQLPEGSEQRKAAAAYSEYKTARAPLLDRAFTLAIAASCAADTREQVELKAVNLARASLSDKAVAALRAVLLDDQKIRFDEEFHSVSGAEESK